MDGWKVMDEGGGRALVRVEPGVSSSLGEAVVVDDSPLWLAWETAKEAWLESKRRLSGSGNTVSAYEVACRQFFEFAGVAPWQVSSGVAQEWAGWMASDRGGKGPLSDSSINQKLAALSSFYEFVQRRYRFHTPDGREVTLWPADRANPFDAVERARITQFGRATFPTVEEMEAILAAIHTESLAGKRDFALIYTYLVTCRRFSELINLKWGDIWKLEDGKYAFRYRYKGGKIRRQVLEAECYQAICAYLRADGRPPEEMGDGDYVFVPMYPERIQRLPGWEGRELEANRPISNSMANRILKKYARRAGVDEEKAHVHALRHVGARRRVRHQKATRGRVDYGEIQEVLGHSSMDMTMIYSKTVAEEPEDPDGQAMARAWLPRQDRRKRRREPPGEQLKLDIGD